MTSSRPMPPKPPNPDETSAGHTRQEDAVMKMETERRRPDQKWTAGDRGMHPNKKQPAGASEIRYRAEDQVVAGGGETGASLNCDHTRQLLKELQVLTKANAELEAFNATVSHDLCAPITAINGYCQLLAGICRDQLDDQASEYLGNIYDATLQMKRLIASLLHFSRVGRVELHREKVDLSGLADETAARLHSSAPQRLVTFRIARGITAESDPGLCRSVLDNIMGNAWKYSLGREKTVIEFGVTKLSGKPVCFIRDNGPGFDMALADAIFAPFRRIPGAAVEGHGIGLATVERIVRRHGGRVWAESEPGRGATFFFTME